MDILSIGLFLFAGMRMVLSFPFFSNALYSLMNRGEREPPRGREETATPAFEANPSPAEDVLAVLGGPVNTMRIGRSAGCELDPLLSMRGCRCADGG